MKKAVILIVFTALLLSVSACFWAVLRDESTVSESTSRQAPEQEEDENPSPAPVGEEPETEVPDITVEPELETEEPDESQQPDEPEAEPDETEAPADEPDEIEEPEETPDEAEGDVTPRFISLSAHEAVVRDFNELKDALSNDNGITTVYFAADITMEGGILINSKKQHVVICGLNPLEPEQTVPYRLTDTPPVIYPDTIYINSSDVSTVTVRDLKITGKNFYGPVCVNNSSALINVTLIYERVDYNGPQIVYHRYGTARFKDCNVRIHSGNGGSDMQEFSEVKHLIFEGENTIVIESSLWSVFYHPLNGSFTVADDASLIVVSPNTSTAYGVFYSDGPSYLINISIGERATLDMTVSGSVALAGVTTISGITVREGGAFLLTTTKNAAADVLRCGGALTVEKDARFVISGYGGSAYSLLRQAGSDITVMQNAVFQLKSNNAYSSLLNLVGRSFTCDDSSSVLFYNANRNILATSSSQLHINAQQVNYWNALSNGGHDSPPLRGWHKTSGENFTLSGTIAIGASGNISGISSNYAPGDPPGAAPSGSTFSMVDARVLSFGRLHLTVIDPTVKSTAVSGVTKPYATVRVSYSYSGTETTLPDAFADEHGIFHIPLDTPLAADTVVTVNSTWNYLYATAKAVVTTDGTLELFVPDTLEFFVTDIPATATTVKRLHRDWTVTVSDDRGIGSSWSVYMRLESEMTPDRSELPVLSDSLIYIDDDGTETVLSVGSEILVMRRTSVENDEITPIIWDENHGVLLSVHPGTAYTNTTYSATISWILIDGP